MLDVLTMTTLIFKVASYGKTGGADRRTRGARRTTIVTNGTPGSLLARRLGRRAVRLLGSVPSSSVPCHLSANRMGMGINSVGCVVPINGTTRLDAPARGTHTLNVCVTSCGMLGTVNGPATRIRNMVTGLTASLGISFILSVLGRRTPGSTAGRRLRTFLGTRRSGVVRGVTTRGGMSTRIRVLNTTSTRCTYLVTGPALIMRNSTASTNLSAGVRGHIDVLRRIITSLTTCCPSLGRLNRAVTPLGRGITSVRDTHTTGTRVVKVHSTLLGWTEFLCVGEWMSQLPVKN